MKNTYKFKCENCGNAMVKAGKNGTGKQRYKCNFCNTRTVVKKENRSRQNELKAFVNWLIDTTTGLDGQTVNRRRKHGDYRQRIRR